MPGLGHWPALLLVLIVVLIIWGPGKLPEIGSAVGRAMHEFRKQSSDFQDEIRRSATGSTVETYHPVEPSVTPASDIRPATQASEGGAATPASEARPSAPDVQPPTSNPSPDVKA